MNAPAEAFGRTAIRLAALASLVGVVLLPGCNSTAPPQEASEVGSIIDHPDSSPLSSKRFVVDPNEQGDRADLRMSNLAWGRMVDVYDQAADGSRTLQHRDFVINADVSSDGLDFLLESDPVTSEDNLVILHPFGGEDGIDDESDAYHRAFDRLIYDFGLIPIEDRDVDGIGIFTMVPRNATIVIQLNDLIDPETVDGQSIRLQTGSPPQVVFEARIITDQNFGDLTTIGSQTVFRSSRILVDLTVSEFESFETDPPLTVNNTGLPAATGPNLANVALRIPTLEREDLGQEVVVRNLSGHKLLSTGNGTVDFGSETVDLLRGFRSGGQSVVTGDPYNGFMKDNTPPRIIGRLDGVLTFDPISDPDGDGLDFTIPQLQFMSALCARTPRVGEILRQEGILAVVTAEPLPHNDGVVGNLEVRLLAGDPIEFRQGLVQYLMPYDSESDEDKQVCFVRVDPPSSTGPNDPGGAISTTSTFTVRFSEPMDPESINAFDSLILTREADPIVSSDYVVGQVLQSVDLQEFTFIPELSLSHQAGSAESYFISLVDSDLSATDLAGNSPAEYLPQVQYNIDPDAVSISNGGRVTRFSSNDEEAPFGDADNGDLPEWSGQHLYDVNRQLVMPRPVVRYEAVVDRTQDIVTIMTPVATGILTPLSRWGAKSQSVWRYPDLGLGLLDPIDVNIDVESLNWAPLGGHVIADNFEEFAVKLSHSLYLPDEIVDPLTLAPIFPESGLQDLYEGNVLDEANDPLKLVHSRERGYVVSPGDVFATGTGTLMIPYPMNQDVPVSEFQYFTFRNTGVYARGAPNGNGVEIVQNWAILGIDPMTYVPVMGPDDVSTIGLPLLMQFECFPDDESVGGNTFDISRAGVISTRPAFRAFSEGGVDQSGVTILRDPDLEREANGGFNPLSNPPGAATEGLDDLVYMGSLDLVTRVSRSYSVWFQTTGTANPLFNPPTLDPAPEDQPVGAELVVSFRGASNITSNDDVKENADTLDLYGDHYSDPANNRASGSANAGITFTAGGAWHEDPSAIDGSSYYQVRLTWISNTESGVTPELSALGMTWNED